MKGTTFESFAEEIGIREDVYAVASKRVLAYQIAKLMADQNIGKTKMAARMDTSRSQLERLLDPTNDAVQLNTIRKAAAVLGREVRIELVEIERSVPDAA